MNCVKQVVVITSLRLIQDGLYFFAGPLLSDGLASECGHDAECISVDSYEIEINGVSLISPKGFLPQPTQPGLSITNQFPR